MSTGLKRWKPYPAYKDSGVEWLGMVPEGWEVKRLKYVATNTTSSVDKLSKDDEIDVFLCNYIDVYKNDIISDALDFMKVTATKKEIEKYSLDSECVVITKDSEAWTDIAIPAYVSPGLKNVLCGYHLAIIKSEKIIGKFLYYILSSNLINQQFQIAANGVTRFGLPHLGVNNAWLPYSPLSEQQAIAAFLDQQCAQIDSLIEKKQRMLDLLDEKRRAVITQAVTRGLDPTVPMKDSGVEWLGMVPEGWKVGRVAFGYDIVLGKMLQPSPNSELDIAVSYYRAMNVQWENIDGDLKVMWATPEEIKNFGVRQGDLLVCEGGEVGRAAIISFPVDEPTIIQNALHRVRAFENGHVRYLLRVLEHVASADWFFVLCNKSTIAHFTGEKFKALKCPLPPLHEQQAIADYLDAQCAVMDSQRKCLEKSIELLREYRASLITHAVTGKIDVRDIAPLQ